MLPRRVPPPGLVRVANLISPRGIPLCGEVLDIPGKAGDWICHQPGMRTNGFCKMHGGQSMTRSLFGKRSKLLDELGMTTEFAEFRTDPELVELRHEIALIDTRVDQAIRRVKKDDTPGNEKRLLDLLALRRKLVDSVKRTTATETVPVDRVMQFVQAMINVMLEFVKDPREKQTFLAKVRALSGRDTFRDGPIDVPATTVERVG
jgi:hypothetical protein